MVTAKRTWSSPAKRPRKTVEGRCRYCHKKFNDVGKHIKDSHKGEKGYEEELSKYGIFL